MKVKSELKMVTETCTSTITSVSTSQPRQNKVCIGICRIILDYKIRFVLSQSFLVFGTK